jgi:hypothetical protein
MKKSVIVLATLLILAAWGYLQPRFSPVSNGGGVVEKATGEQSAASFKEDYFTSSAGIVYGKDWSGKFPTRVAHVMAHTQPDPSKKKHSVFVEKSRAGVLAMLDEAWKKRGPPQRQGGSRGRDVYDVDMGRVVGTQGERRIKIVVEKDSAKIVTAYPTR